MPNFRALTLSRKQNKFGCTSFAQLQCRCWNMWALEIYCTVKPPLTATCKQRPLVFVPGTKNPYTESCFKPLYNGHLFTMATFFGRWLS